MMFPSLFCVVVFARGSPDDIGFDGLVLGFGGGVRWLGRGDVEGVEQRAGGVEIADEQGQVDQAPLPVGPLGRRVKRGVDAVLGAQLLGESSSELLVVGELFGDFMDAEATSTSLNNRVRQVVILTVGAVWKSPYELYAHSAEARQAGLPDEVIEALVAGQIPAQLPDDEKLAARFAQQLTAQRRVDAALYAEAERVYGQRALVDLALLVGFFHTTCAVLNAFEIPAPRSFDFGAEVVIDAISRQ